MEELYQVKPFKQGSFIFGLGMNLQKIRNSTNYWQENIGFPLVWPIMTCLFYNISKHNILLNSKFEVFIKRFCQNLQYFWCRGTMVLVLIFVFDVSPHLTISKVMLPIFLQLIAYLLCMNQSYREVENSLETK